jgi:hypothetical protein
MLEEKIKRGRQIMKIAMDEYWRSCNPIERDITEVNNYEERQSGGSFRCGYETYSDGSEECNEDYSVDNHCLPKVEIPKGWGCNCSECDFSYVDESSPIVLRYSINGSDYEFKFSSGVEEKMVKQKC